MSQARLFDDYSPSTRLMTWGGSKMRQMPILTKYFPQKYRNYVEPFLGSGALLLNKYDDISDKFFLSEKCQPLYNLWQHMVKNTDEFLLWAVNYRNDYGGTKEEYYLLKDHFNLLIDVMPHSSQIAGLTWMLSYCCMNKLVRFSKKGKWSQSWGINADNTGGSLPPDPEKMFTQEYKEKLHSLANRWVFKTDFRDSMDLFLEDANENDICYLDPPYILSGALYNQDWTIADLKDLFGYIRKMDEIGVRWLYSDYLYFGDEVHPFIDTINEYCSIKQIERGIDPTPLTQKLGRTKRYGEEYLIVSKNNPWK
jgi:DNA adenine methylase